MFIYCDPTDNAQFLVGAKPTPVYLKNATDHAALIAAGIPQVVISPDLIAAVK